MIETLCVTASCRHADEISKRQLISSYPMILNRSVELTCGAFLERSTTMESTTTSLQAVPSEPTTVASRAPAGDLTTVPMAAQDADPAQGGSSLENHLPKTWLNCNDLLKGKAAAGLSALSLPPE